MICFLLLFLVNLSLSLSLSDELSPVGTLSKKMHTLLLQQMWWRLKGNSFAKVMNFMPRFVWFFFCSFVFNPCQHSWHNSSPLAVRWKNKNKKQMNNSKPLRALPVQSQDSFLYLSLSGTNLSLSLFLFRQFGPRLVRLLTRFFFFFFLNQRRSVTTHSKGFCFSPSKGSVQTETKRR